MSPLRRYWILVRWDWNREMKRKDTIVSMVLFALVTLMIFSFAIPPDSETGVKARAGVLWVTFLLAGSIGIDRAFRDEEGGRVLEGLLLSPVGRIAIFYARFTSTFLFVVLMEGVTFVAFCLLYNVDLSAAATAKIAAVALGATAGFVAAGVTLSAMTRSIHGSDVILRILLFPLLIPIFYAAVHLTGAFFRELEPRLLAIAIIAAFDLVYLAAGQILFEQIVADFDG
ncbi:MAG: heme exporter protein CcmB [Planctomycetota bacterium]